MKTDTLMPDGSRSTLIAAWVRSKIGRVPGRGRIEGFVDHVVAEEVYGWAFDPSRPNRRVLVTATAGGEVISEALADLPRKDLADAHKGDGRHGFRLRLPRDLPPEKRAQVRIEAVAKPRNIVLQRGEIVIPTPATPAKESDPATSTRPSVGVLESFQNGVLKGWAIDPNHPAAVARLDIYDGEVFLGTVTCERERTKAKQAGARDFAFRMPIGFEATSGQTLRARISGTRLELKRGRNYPANASVVEEVSEPSPSILAEGAPPKVEPGRVSRAEQRARRKTPGPVVDVLFLICGGFGTDSATKASCADQTWGNVRALRAGGDEGKLLAAIASSSIVVLLQSGQTADRDLATALMRAPVAADLWTWLTPDRNSEAADPDIAASLNPTFNGALALRSTVLGGFDGDLAATLARGDIHDVVRWAAGAGLRWSRLFAPLSSGPVTPSSASVLAPPAPPRLSLAVWTGWERGLSPALPNLLAHCGGFHVEILVPAGAEDMVEDRLAALAPKEVVALTVRRVDAPVDGGPMAWRAISEAASGQVIVLCHGELLLPAQGFALADACAWAHQPRFGAVTIEISSDDQEPPLAGLTVTKVGGSLHPVNAYDGARGGQPRPVLAAPPLFMALSRSALAAVGGFNEPGLDGAAAVIDLSLRLRRAGRVAALLGQHRATAPRSAINDLLDRPFSSSALALIAEAAEKAAVDYPAPQDPSP